MSQNAIGPAIVAVGGGAVALFTAYSLYWWHEGEKLEKPKYTVSKVLVKKRGFKLRDYNEVEVRDYEPYIIAEATVQAPNMNKGMGKGFMTVAKFIFGDNTKVGGEESEKVAMTAPVRAEMPEASESISMTAPVQMTINADVAAAATATATDTDAAPAPAPEQSGTYKVSFVMPSKYTIGTLPLPKNAELVIKEVPAHKTAVFTYYGAAPSPKRLKVLGDQLKADVEADGLAVEGDVMLYQYHPPFAPFFVRRVEVLYKVK